MPYDVSIVMITWCATPARLALLKRSFLSFKECTQIPHRLIVIDNGLEEQTEYLKAQEIDDHVINNVNLGVGISRNLGAARSDSEYIAFVDHDLVYYPGWLKNCIDGLEANADRLLIATGTKNHPMKYAKHHVGDIGEYSLWNRCSAMCLVMRRRDFDTIGPWSVSTSPGGKFSKQARAHKYLFVWHPTWLVRHIGKSPSYHYKKQVFVNGQWLEKESKKCQSNAV